MFGFKSKKKEQPLPVPVEVATEEPKRVNQQYETILAIHNAFSVASEESIIASNKILAECVISEEDKEEADMLKKLGFTGMEKVKEAAYKDSKAEEARRRAAIVQKYTVKYPQYKFIFEDQVKAICQKYGLVCGEVSRYRGTVPKKNLLEIADFKVSDEDTYVSESKWTRYGGDAGPMISKSKLAEQTKDDANLMRTCPEYYSMLTIRQGKYYTAVPFFICAPKDEMDTSGMHLRDGVFIEKIPDPIVLHRMPDGFLIVSKWGLEGKDPALVNETMN